MSYQRISIVLPIYNQGDHIEAILESYADSLARISVDHEFILVVNNSRDNSLAVCQRLAEKLDNVGVLYSEEGGWGLAVKLGLQHASGDLLCYTNSARTAPQDLQLLILYATANPNTVIKANRKVRDNWLRRMGSLLYNLECRNLFNLAYWDINGTPKVFPRHFDELVNLQEDGDLIDLEFNIVCRQEDYPVLEVPILTGRRHGGKSTTNFGSAFNMYLGALRLWRTMRDASS
jgi:glycosyltransferase involved in cell wall biosynthesis